MQLEGIDPPAFSRFLDTVQAATSLGFRRLKVTGTARRFADAEFRREFLRLAPSDTIVYVPFYGVTAEVHDAVTGRPGAYAEIGAALEGLLADGGRERVALTTVATRRNLAEIPDLVVFAGRRKLRLFGQLPYPSYRAASDGPYRVSAVRERDVVETIAAALGRRFRPFGDRRTVPWRYRRLAIAFLSQAIPHPCLLWHAQRRTGWPLLQKSARWTMPLPGTDSGGTTLPQRLADGSLQGIATVRCPHADRCRLASACPQAHYALYAELFTLDEFVPPPDHTAID